MCWLVHHSGRNTCGQLGFGDTTTRNVPELVPALRGKNIIHAAVGRHHTLFVTGMSESTFITFL